ncbi:MAG: aminopeptidase P N-terminal domain-containing protein, partial [Candidatus Aminicenantes bacterium]
MKKHNVRWLLVLLIIFSVSAFGSLDAEDFNKEIFQKRRQKLMEQMDGGIAVLRSGGNMSDFYYLTGLYDQNAIILIIPEGKEKYIMFIQPTSPSRELWTGKRPGLEEAKTVFGADKAFPINEFDKSIFHYLREKSKIYVSFRDKELYEKLIPMIRSPYGNKPVPVVDPRPYIHEMRLIKDTEEIKLMRRAAEITSEALVEVMKAVKPGMFEYEAEAIIEYIFRKNGAQRPGFPSIVGSGPNSNILHYEDNNRQTQDGDLLLMDVGAEYNHYTADVTRTIPVNGRFSAKQKEIYEVVLQAQKEAIKIAAPGVGIYE